MGDAVDKMNEENPLLQFSLYTVIQVQSLRDVGEEIIGLSKDWTDSITDSERVYNLFWLWVLGAYEVLRTMHHHKECFVDPLQSKIGDAKRDIATIRMPFAKQEMKGHHGPIYSELSIAGFGKGIEFEISGETYSSTTVVENFLKLIDSIEPKDVKGMMPVRSPD